MKKLILMILMMSFAVIGYSQRRYHPHRHCRDSVCTCDSTMRRFSDGRGQGYRNDSWRRNNRNSCRFDSLYNKTDINQQLDKTEFGDFQPLAPDDNNQKVSPVDSLRGSGNSGLEIDHSSDDFGAFTEFNSPENSATSKEHQNFPWIVAALAATAIAGIFMRFKQMRRFRNIFLIASLVFFGFFLGGCPCPVSGIQNVMLAGLGITKSWQSMLWFLGLIPLTYVFGKVWCGWICHLGGLQELIFRPGKLNLLKSERASRILKWTRGFLLLALVGQVIITRTNLYREIDPFKAAFNLYASNTATIVLLVLLLLSSIFIYRPFCRAVCPVGLVLGWISKIPGASVIRNSEECSSCKLCMKNCNSVAITKAGTKLNVDNEDCIRCGQCMEACMKDRLKLSIRRMHSAKAA